MKTHKKLARKNIFYILIIIVIFSAIIIGCIYYYRSSNTNHKSAGQSEVVNAANQIIDSNPPTVDQKQAGENQKITNQTPVSTTASTIITVKNVTADMLQIRSMTSGAISDSGVCSLTLTNNDKVITKTASTYAMPSSSTCQGFNIDRTELTNGTWKISLTVVIGNERSSTNDEITLE